MRNDFEFGFFGIHIQAHDWGIVAGAAVASAIVWIAFNQLSSWQALLLILIDIIANRRLASFMSSPAEQAQRSEGKGTQVKTRGKSRRISVISSSKAEQTSPLGSANYADAMASLARAKCSLPKPKRRAARARRG